jgi:hypothetical protein
MIERQVAAPMPLEAPVTRIRLPVRSALSVMVHLPFEAEGA